jgi:hypothetical protein
MARTIKNAMIASHAADIRSSTASPTPRSGGNEMLRPGEFHKFREVNRGGNSAVNLSWLKAYFADTTSE